MHRLIPILFAVIVLTLVITMVAMPIIKAYKEGKQFKSKTRPVLKLKPNPKIEITKK